MSVNVSRRVWDASQHGGSELLMLLAISDHADDEGVAWPSVRFLAKKIRQSERNAHYLLSKLVASGELVIERNKGPKGCNLFRVKTLQGAKIAGVQSVAGGGATAFIGGVQPLAPEPSVNHQRTTRAISSPEKLPCPADEIVEAYHRMMPDNPRCKNLSPARRRNIKARWLEAAKLQCKPFGYSTVAEGLSAWESFFATCADSAFLTGKVAPQSGKLPFLADIDFLFSPRGFTRCLENKYHREAA